MHREGIDLITNSLNFMPMSQIMMKANFIFIENKWRGQKLK